MVLGLAAGLTIAIGPAAAQSGAEPARPSIASSTATATATTTDNTAQPDIVVNGVRYPIKVETQAYGDLPRQRQAVATAQMFSRCVKGSDTLTRESLHNLIDGQPHREVRSTALRQIALAYRACPGLTTPAVYDRGALVERALALFAPDLSFTSAQLLQPDIMARYRAREDRFDLSRPQWEREEAKLAGCLVASRPELALAYPGTEPNSDEEDRIRAALIGSSPECVGGAKQLTIDAPLFRVFLADALYSWAVAVRGSDTLIPLPPKYASLKVTE